MQLGSSWEVKLKEKKAKSNVKKLKLKAKAGRGKLIVYKTLIFFEKNSFIFSL